jgi:hypothetical protein
MQLHATYNIYRPRTRELKKVDITLHLEQYSFVVARTHQTISNEDEPSLAAIQSGTAI